MLESDIVVSGAKTYTNFKPLAVEGRVHAKVYLCEDELGKPFVAKHFFDKSPKPISSTDKDKSNHFGRRRDGCEPVFGEIQRCHSQDFLVKHIDLILFKEKWLIILEFIDGEMLGDFIRGNHTANIELVKQSIKSLAETLTIWHNNGFAHGDPHLNNALVLRKNNYAVKLIDYSLIHNENFEYCKKCHCFSQDKNQRFKQDLENDFGGKIGEGFRYEILCVQEELGMSSILSDVFDKYYQYRG
jgi:serine/threonine protein kinase